MNTRNHYASTVLANFAGKSTNWREIMRRCGFSDHETGLALRELKSRGLVTGNWECNAEIEILVPGV